MARPKKPGSEYSVLIKCVDCGKGRWVMPQDEHHAKRCKEHQKVAERARRAAAQRERRAAAAKLRKAKVRRKAA